MQLRQKEGFFYRLLTERNTGALKTASVPLRRGEHGQFYQDWIKAVWETSCQVSVPMGNSLLIHYLLLKRRTKKVKWRSHPSPFFCLTMAKRKGWHHFFSQWSALATTFRNLELLASLISGTCSAAYGCAASPQTGLPWHGREPGAIYKLISRKYVQVL